VLIYEFLHDLSKILKVSCEGAQVGAPGTALIDALLRGQRVGSACQRAPGRHGTHLGLHLDS
jgi:hypothetical protein